MFQYLNDRQHILEIHSAAYLMIDHYSQFLEIITKNTSYSQAVLKSGLAWKILQACLLSSYSSYAEQSIIFKIDTVVKKQVKALRNTLLHPQDSLYSKVMYQLLGTKIVDNMIVANEEEAVNTTLDNLNKNIENPEYVWNTEIKEELNQLLSKQMQSIDNGKEYCCLLLDYSYETLRKYTNIDGLYIEIYNKDLFYKINNVEKRISSFMKEITNINKNQLWLTQSEYCEKIIACLCNIVYHMNGVEIGFICDEYIKAITNFLILAQKETNDVVQRIATIYLDMFEKIVQIPKHTKFLIKNPIFNHFLFSQLQINTLLTLRLLNLLKKIAVNSVEYWVSGLGIPYLLMYLTLSPTFSSEQRNIAIYIIRNL